MRRNVKKLVLNRETVRTLQDAELKQVAGGRPALLKDELQGNAHLVTDACPCGSTMTDTVAPMP